MKNGGVLQREEIERCSSSIIIIRGKLSSRQRRRSIMGRTKVLKKLVMHLSFPTNESFSVFTIQRVEILQKNLVLT